MYVKAFARVPSEEEISDAIEFLQIQSQEYRISEDQIGSDERLWADLGHVLINTKPFIYIN